MRVLLAVAAVVLLSACNNDQAANVATEDGNVVSESLRGNDITAIDAATNDSANMAADVDFTLNEANVLENETAEPAGNEAETNTAETNAAR